MPKTKKQKTKKTKKIKKTKNSTKAAKAAKALYKEKAAKKAKGKGKVGGYHKVDYSQQVIRREEGEKPNTHILRLSITRQDDGKEVKTESIVKVGNLVGYCPKCKKNICGLDLETPTTFLCWGCGMKDKVSHLLLPAIPQTLTVVPENKQSQADTPNQPKKRGRKPKVKAEINIEVDVSDVSDDVVDTSEEIEVVEEVEEVEEIAIELNSDEELM